MSEEIKKNTPRDVFLHLLAVVTLYWSAISFVTMLWQYINKLFPDTLDYFPAGFNEPMRMAMASLIIVFPVFIAVSWFLNKIYKKEVYVRESKIRKWLIYLTLFIAALVIIGDLVTVINTFLNGEIKTRFILKALSILLVAGFIFWYYLDDVKRDSTTKLAKPFAWISGALVLIVVVCAFFIVGSPMTARLMEFDQRKIDNLFEIQNMVTNYWQSKEKLPATLAELSDPLSGFVAPKDPQTGADYEYRILNNDLLKFELCANFNKEYRYQENASVAKPYWALSDPRSRNWNHGEGRVCFERTIDKELYPPLNKAK